MLPPAWANPFGIGYKWASLSQPDNSQRNSQETCFIAAILISSDCWTEKGWDLSFRRLLNDWEIERVAKLLEGVGTFAGTNNTPDAVKWAHSKGGIFSVGRAYRKEGNVQVNNNQRLWKRVWKNSAPTKVKCFTWLVDRKACLTRQVLWKKGKIIISWCSLCGKTGETKNHLFLHCPFTTQIWSMFLNISSVEWTIARKHCSFTKFLD